VVIKLRSQRLAQLFAEVWERLPAADQTLLSHRTKLVLDNPSVFPSGYLSHRSVWGMAIGIGVKKSIAIVYLSPRKLPRQPDDFVKYVIAHEFAHIFCGHVEQLFFSALSDSCEEDQEAFEVEADQQVSVWGFPVLRK
jgi:hypothetical protein